MVSQADAPRRDRILDAAAEEFAARGLDGAKVDRIAARARVNKALLYYYFQNKAALYRETLLDVFRTVATAVVAVREHGGTPETQLGLFIQAIAEQTARRPRFPVIWLREMSEGGRHLDESIALEMRKVIETLGAILQEGHRAGLFCEANPFVVQISIVAPLLMFSATAPLRERFRHLVPKSFPIIIPREVVVEHVRTATLAALRVRTANRPAARPAPRSSRRVSS
jgi:TetR/AcrR family transcriptional regulator